jgi:tRNA threonylcarbamoyladenosine biosynthesis protein TsaB
MRVLALDTATPAGSVAVVDATEVLFAREGDARRTHIERLPGDLQIALGALALSSADIDVFAVVAGPGSFTGLRIGIAAMQGLAVVHGRRMVAVPTLLGLAAAASEGLVPGTLVGAWMDAHRGEIFSALWRVTEAPRFAPGHLLEVEASSVGPPQETLERWTRTEQTPALIVGDGAIRYASIVDGVTKVLSPPMLAPLAGLVASARASAGDTIDPAGVMPIYVRRPDAELARDNLPRRAQGNGANRAV